jgi:hypothetical protein
MAFTNRYPKSYQRLAGRFASEGRSPGERRVLVAKYAGQCRSCRRPTEIGETIYWAAGAGAICQDCQDGKPVQTVLPAAASPVSEIVEAATDWEAKERPSIAIEDAGVYVLPDGTIVKVQANREKTRTYAKRFVEIRAERATEAGPRAHGEYQYEPGLVEEVARTGRRMNLEEAKAFILRYGFCVRCGRHLKAAQSVEEGLGPICRRYFAGEAAEGHDHKQGEADASPEPHPADVYGTPEHEADLIAWERETGDGYPEPPTTEQLGGDTRPDPEPDPEEERPGRQAAPSARAYTCVSRRCRDRGTIWEGPTPADARLATGRPVLCPKCGDVAVLRPQAAGAAA